MQTTDETCRADAGVPNINFEFPPALPPPKEYVLRQKRKYILQSFFCIFCAMTAAFVLFLCAIEKISSIREQGLLAFIGETLISSSDGESRGLCDMMSASTFGEAEKTATTVQALPFLPRIYYIPKEQIADEIYLEKAELERRIFELYSFDYSKVPKGKYAIIPTDLSASDATELRNDTAYNINMEEIEKQAKLIEATVLTEEPLVLVVHTHGTESFSADGSICYGDEYNYPRSTDITKNVVAVGKVLCDELGKRGINALHCEIMHDKDSYIDAYERSAESIREYLETYPSIRYVFDVHRDSLIRTDLTKLRPVTLNGGTDTAQMMMIVGTSEKGAGEYNWQSNLVLAEAIQQRLCKDTLGVPREIYLRGASYNQQLSPSGLLLEIGSCGNYLSEAKAAAKVFAAAFADVLDAK